MQDCVPLLGKELCLLLVHLTAAMGQNTELATQKVGLESCETVWKWQN